MIEMFEVEVVAFLSVLRYGKREKGVFASCFYIPPLHSGSPFLSFSQLTEILLRRIVGSGLVHIQRISF